MNDYVYHGKRYWTSEPKGKEHIGWNSNFEPCEILRTTPKQIIILSPSLGELRLNRIEFEKDGKVYHSKPHEWFYKEKPLLDPERPLLPMSFFNSEYFTGKGIVVIDDVEYQVEIINGERYIDGKTVDDFYGNLPIETICRLATIGLQAIRDEIRGIERDKGEYQEKLSELEFLDY